MFNELWSSLPLPHMKTRHTFHGIQFVLLLEGSG